MDERYPDSWPTSPAAWREWPDDEEAELLEADRRERRHIARRRRRNVFGVMCAVGALTGLLGLVPALRGLWIVFAIDLAFLVAFVGLAMYGQRIEAERDQLAMMRAEDRWAANDDPDYLSTAELTDIPSATDDFYEEEDRQLVGKA
jgi:hypothetical protein